MKKIFFYNFISVIILFLLIETTISLFLPITKQGISPNLINENTIEPKFNFPNVENEKVFGEIVFTDSNGYRIVNKNFKKKNFESNQDIFFIGGSVTFGMGVKQQNTFSGLLNEDLKNYNVHNASVVASDLKNNYYILKNKINKKNLELVIINFSLDDLANSDENSNDEIYYKKNLIEKLKQNKFISHINNFIRANSKLYVLAKNLIFDAENNYYDLAKKNFEDPKKINYLKKYLDKISYLNKELNRKVIFISIPYSKQVSKKNCETQQPEEKIIEYEMKLREINFFNLKNYFCNDHKNFYLKFDPAHLSDLGHHKVYEYIKKEIL